MNQYLTIWGSNSDDQLNIPFAFNNQIINLKSGIENIDKISLGFDHGLAQYTSNNGFKYIQGWGQNYFGENNINSNFFYNDFDAGINTTYLVDNYGRIHGHGKDLLYSDVSLYTGQIINTPLINPLSFPENGGLPALLPSYELNINSVRAGSGYVIALTNDGKITGWGNSGNPVISGRRYTGINALGFVTGISAGYTHALALLKDGIITGWGNNSNNQLNFNTGIISGIKISTRANDNLFMGLYYPIITNITTGLINTSSTGWIINYIGTGRNITGINIERTLNLSTWTGDFKTGSQIQIFNKITGSGYQLDNKDYYIRLITSNNIGNQVTGSYSIFNPLKNKFKIGDDYKLYYNYKPNINTVWKNQRSWTKSTGIYNNINITDKQNNLSQILFTENGKKQLLYTSIDILESVDSGNSWRFKKNTNFERYSTIYSFSGMNLSFSPNGDNLNAIFNKNCPCLVGSYAYDFSPQGLVLFDTNFNNILGFSQIIDQPISYCLDESQISGNNQINWIRDYGILSNLTFGFKSSHLSNLYTVLVADDSEYQYTDVNSNPQTLNLSGRLALFENWKTGIYTGWFIGSLETGKAFVFSLQNNQLFPLRSCDGCDRKPDPFFERSAVFKDKKYYDTNIWNIKQKLTGDNNSGYYGTSIASNSQGTVLIMGGRRANNGSGAAIVYTGSANGPWAFSQKLTGDGGIDEFGMSVYSNTSGTVLIIGKTGDNNGSGAAIVYTGSANGPWAFRQKLTGDGGIDEFGTSVALNADGGIIVVGSRGDNITNGSAMVFSGNQQDGWNFRQKLLGHSAGDLYGTSVACTDNANIIIVGGPLDNVTNLSNAGGAMVWEGNPFNGWLLKQTLTGSVANVQFGQSVATNSSGTVIMMASIIDNNNSGSSLIYNKEEQDFIWHSAKITDSKFVAGIVEDNKFNKNLASINFDTGIFQNYDGNYINNFDNNIFYSLYKNNRNWIDIDVSETAQYQTAIANTGISGYIYITENSGKNWTEVGLYSGNFIKVKVSKNGKYQIILKEIGNNLRDISSSDDYGKTWNSHNFYDQWKDIAISNDGLQAVINNKNLYYNYFIDYNENYLKIKDNKILDIAAGYNSNLVITEKPVMGDIRDATVLNYIEDSQTESFIEDLSTVVIENSWFNFPNGGSANGFYNYIETYNNKPSYLSTGDFNGKPTNNFIRWGENRWNVYFNYSIIVYYSSEDTSYPWEVKFWSGLTTGAQGTFKQMNPNYYFNTGYTGGNFGTIKKYTFPVPYGQTIECSGYIFDE